MMKNLHSKKHLLTRTSLFMHLYQVALNYQNYITIKANLMLNSIFILLLDLKIEVLEVRQFNSIIHIISLFLGEKLTANVTEFIRKILKMNDKHKKLNCNTVIHFSMHGKKFDKDAALPLVRLRN